MNRSLLLPIAAALVVVLAVWRVFFWQNPNYLYAEEFKMTWSLGMTPTDEMGNLLVFDLYADCAGIEVDDRGLEIDMRLVRAGAPDVQPDFPLQEHEHGMAVEVRHPRVAAKGQGVVYTLYDADDVVVEQWTLTPTID